MFQKEKFLQELKQKILYVDGAMGTMLQQKGFLKGCPDELNLTHPEVVQSVHQAYAQVGTNLILTNTFGANRDKLSKYSLGNKVKEINLAAVKNAREAAPHCLVVGELGPLSQYLEPLGELTFTQAYEIYREQLEGLLDADLIIISTMSDLKMMKAALIATKETGKLVIASITFEEGLRTSTGTDIKTFVKVVEALGADIIGANCSVSPQKMYEAAKIIAENTNKPVIIQPNAGLPRLVAGKTVYDSTPQEFSEYARKMVALGVNILGGCCGTNPEFIRAMIEATKNLIPHPRNNFLKTSFCSRTRTIELENKSLIIGERINPSGKKSFREELKQGNLNTVRIEAFKQKEEGASLLDLNLGVPGTDEVNNLKKAVSLVENLVDLPLVLDTTNKEALEEALQQVSGKPLINSVNGDEKSLQTILPLAKKYGAGVIALCLDEKGLPKTAEERIKIAQRIIQRATALGISSQDIIVDGLTLTIATNPENEKILLEAVKKVKESGYKTVLGISNISYGLPNRSEINQKFFTKAVQAGVDLIILNPQDNILREETEINLEIKKEKVDYEKMDLSEKLFSAVLYGDQENISPFVEEALPLKRPLEINNILISGLEEVGKRFNRKEIFLPQVLAAAETTKRAFQRLKQEFSAEKKSGKKIIFATVENDIHDLGKNMVIAVVESYGYDILDLGTNVPLNKIIDTALQEKADLIALSALMTTTAPEMEKIIKELKRREIKIPVIIGGAVITEDYAQEMGAAYSPDALSAVKTIQKVLEDEKSN